MAKTPSKPGPRIGDAALKARTGRTWKEWFALLDRARARKMNHTEIATHLYQKCGCPGWWSQMVAVGYEQARGLREEYEKPGGFEISRSKTLAVPASRAFAAWQEVRTRARWLPNRITIHKATRNKSMRITWSDGQKSISVNFYPRGAEKCQVSVQHGKLANAKAAERMKNYWAKALDRLAGVVEA